MQELVWFVYLSTKFHFYVSWLENRTWTKCISNVNGTLNGLDVSSYERRAEWSSHFSCERRIEPNSLLRERCLVNISKLGFQGKSIVLPFENINSKLINTPNNISVMFLYGVWRAELCYSRYLLPLLFRYSYPTPATFYPSLLYSTPATKIQLLLMSNRATKE